jgi:glycosyltransferase involved in cell wall biosynthesis
LFLDELNQNDISILMNKSKILVMGSTSEGLPRVLIEAGFCKLPSVATDIDGIYNPFFTNGGTLTYKLNSENDFMNSFNKLNSDEGLWKIQSEKSYKLSNEIAGNGRFVNNWLKIITMINSEL